jgi:chromosome segregation ATPase
MATELRDLTLKSLTEYTTGVVDWYELGFELEVDTIELDKIKRNHESEEAEYCKSKVLEYWDLYCETSREKIVVATTKVLEKQRREREEKSSVEQKKKKLQQEERNILAASNQLQESLNCLDEEVKKFNDKQKRLQEQQKGIKGEWGRSELFWNDEDEKWMKEATANKQLSEAIANTDHEGSKAVIEDFLKRKHLPAYSQLSTEAIETYVNEEIVKAEVKRSEQLKSRRNQIKRYAKQISKLKDVTEKWRELVKNHIGGVEQKVIKTMDMLGLKLEKISSLKDQVKELQSAAEDFGSAVTTSEESLENMRAQLDSCDAELRKHIQTFNSSYQQILRALTKLQDRIRIVNGAITDLQKKIDYLIKMGAGVGTGVGAGVGALIGSVGGPPGALVGALFGAGVGLVVGANYTSEERERANRELQEKEKEKRKLKRELANNKKAKKECQPTAKKAEQILAMWAHLQKS